MLLVHHVAHTVGKADGWYSTEMPCYYSRSTMVSISHQNLWLTVADPGFPGGEVKRKGGHTNLIFDQKFPEICTQIIEIGPRGETVLSTLNSTSTDFGQKNCIHFLSTYV